jgi:predicted ATPase
MASEYGDGVWLVELAAITDPDTVPVAVLRAFGLPDSANRAGTETCARFVATRRMLLVLDNCEHLLDATAALISDLLRSGPSVTIMATSREPIGCPVKWRGGCRRCRWRTRRSSCASTGRCGCVPTSR